MFKKVFLIGTSVFATTFSSKIVHKDSTGNLNLCNWNIFQNCHAAPWISNWDDREHTNNNLNLKRKLIFINHGEYEKNGPLGDRLTSAGIMEMKSSAKRLLELVQDKNCHIRVLNSSTYKRAVQSVEEIRRFLSDNEVKDVPDIDLTDCSGECKPLLSNRDLETDPYKRLSGYFKSSALAEAAYRNFFFRPQMPYSETEHSTIPIEVYVGHPNLHRWFVHRALQLPLGGYLSYTCNGGSFFEFTVHGNGYITCDCVSQSAHVLKDEIVSDHLQKKYGDDLQNINEIEKSRNKSTNKKGSHSNNKKDSHSKKSKKRGGK